MVCPKYVDKLRTAQRGDDEVEAEARDAVWRAFTEVLP